MQDVAKRRAREAAAAAEAERKRFSASVQRDLPRPLQVCCSVLQCAA